MSNRPLRSDAAANRARVLDAAVVAVLRDGERVPMATIAAEAGVGVGTLYRHFPTRADLLAALVRQSFSGVLDNAERAARHPEPVRCIAEFLKFSVRDRDRFVLPLHGGPAVIDEDSARLQRQVRVVIQEVLDRGVADGTIREDVAPRDIIVFGALLSQGLPTFTNWTAVAHRQIALFVAGLGRPAG